MEYLLKTSIVVTIFYTIYRIFLHKETFFMINRFFLLLGLSISFIIPTIIIPIYIKVEESISIVPIEPKIVSKEIIETSNFNYLDLIIILYFIGVLFFTIRFIISLFSIITFLTKKEKTLKTNYRLITTNDNNAPFSFFKWIVLNPNQFSNKELEQVLMHEKVHVKQYHSIDNLIAELTTIILWFNPFVWLYKKSMEQNLEYIADNITYNNFKTTDSYQKLLLKTSIASNTLVMTNTFYNSLIKKRIVMLHKNKSAKRNLLKLTLVIPFLTLFLMSFNTQEIYLNNSSEIKINEQIIIKGIITDEIGTPIEGALVTTGNSGVKTNASGKYAIKVSTGKKVTFSFMSLIPQEIVIKNEKEINITLLSESRLIIDANSKKAKYYYKGQKISKKEFKDLYFSQPKNNKNSVSKKNEYIVSGIIKDENGNPVENAIIFDGKSNGVTTNKDGKFSIKSYKGKQLTISKKGMKSQKINLSDSKKIHITMKK